MKTPSKRTSAQNLKLERRLTKEISPFTFLDLPLSGHSNLFGTKYLFRKIIGTGAFGVVISAIDRELLEDQAIKVTCIII